MTRSPFHERVREAFGRRVAAYEPMARLQRGLAWRLAGLAHHQRGRNPALAFPPGPCADLGAGTGLVGRALAAWQVGMPAPPLQVDLCPEALARNGVGPTLAWDLNQGLPPRLDGAALLTSSFALQWLEAPVEAVLQWGKALAPGGWLLLSVPTAGSFREWHLAAERAGVACSALPLPSATALLAAAARAGLEPVHARTLSFAGQPGAAQPSSRRAGAAQPSSRQAGVGQPGAAQPSAACSAAPSGLAAPPTPPGALTIPGVPTMPGAPTAPGAPGALAALRAMRAIGADASRQATSLSPGAWRRLLAAWPEGGQLSWEVLVLLARKPPAKGNGLLGGVPCGW